MVHIREIRTFDEFLSLKQSWEKLLESSHNEHIFQTYEWNFIWWKHLGKNYHLNIIVLEEDNNIIGILPLVYSERSVGMIRWRRYEFMAPRVSNYHDIILSKDIDLSGVLIALSNYIQSNFNMLDYLELRYVPEESPLSIVFKQRQESLCANWLMFEHESTNLVTIDGTWEKYFKNRSKNLRHDIERKLRRINEAGHFEYVRCGNERQLEKMLFNMFSMQSHNWEKRGKRTYLGQKEYQAFDREMGLLFLRNGWLFSHYLTLDDEIIACHFGFRYNKNVYYHEIAFLMDSFNLSPGKLLQYFELKEAFGSGLKESDFAQGNCFYKDRWCNKERKTYRIYFFKGKPYIRRYYFKALKPIIRVTYIYFKEKIKPGFKRLIRGTKL